jgi:CRISPR-associated protein Csx17
MYTLTLKGCAPVPIAHYLKALGILRLVSEQCDANAVGRWSGDTFELASALDREALSKFFLETYKPTPIIAPWSGGSGFYLREGKTKQKDAATGKLLKTGVRDQPTTASRAIDTVAQAKSERFAAYTATVLAAKAVLSELGLHEAPKEDAKAKAVNAFRNALPDTALDALDTTIVLTGRGPAYPPLMGTGGTDGNLDFTCNFVQRLLGVIDSVTGYPSDQSERWLRASLFAQPSQGTTTDASIGQFFPGAAGGVNSAPGFFGPPAVNPWDFILMVEGATLFSAATTRRLESNDFGSLVYPFTVKAVGVGYGSSALNDEAEARGETWLPIWDRPTSLAETMSIFREGRSQVGGRPARNSIDFARAIASLGVDRGITAFQPFAFHRRFGKNFFATPLERVVVRYNQLASELLAPIDNWLEQFHSKARDKGAPSSVKRTARALEAAIMEFCKTADEMRVQALLISLGECEAAMARSWKWTRAMYLSPVPLLAPRWLREANTGTAEFRLAAALAGLNSSRDRETMWFRCHLEPVRAAGGPGKRWFEWTDTVETNVVWREGDLPQSLNAIFARRILLAGKSGEEGYPDFSKIAARPADIAAFMEGRTDDRLLASLLWGLVLVDFGADYSEDFKIGFPPERRYPSALYALLKLCFSHHELRGTHIPLFPAVHRRAHAGDGAGASMLAARRLRASGLAPAIECIRASGPVVARTAAALLFLITEDDLGELAEQVLRPTESEPQPITTNL